MIRKLASRCLAFLTQRTGIAAAQRDVYLYGIELFLHTLFSTLGLLIISALLHRPIEGSIIIALYYTNQTIGGGFHASAHTRCFLTMSVGLVLALLLLNHQPPFIGICMIVAVAGVLLLLFPLKLHRNKTYLAHKSAVFRKRSRLAVCVEMLVFIALSCFGTGGILYAYALGMAVSAVSRLAAILLGDKETE